MAASFTQAREVMVYVQNQIFSGSEQLDGLSTNLKIVATFLERAARRHRDFNKVSLAQASPSHADSGHRKEAAEALSHVLQSRMLLDCGKQLSAAEELQSAIRAIEGLP